MNNTGSSKKSDKKINKEVGIKIKLIKNLQSLPEEVVIKFIESKGKLMIAKEGKLKIARKTK